MSGLAIIFGANGQDGYYLNLLLDSFGLNVIRISRTTGDQIGSIGDFDFNDADHEKINAYDNYI